MWYSVPAALVQLSLRGDLDERDLRTLRWVLFAGETFPAGTCGASGSSSRRHASATSMARRKSTSAPSTICLRAPFPTVALPIGRACCDAGTLVADAGMQPVPDGEIGDLFVRGSTVMSGYWNDPDRNHQVLVRRPGDAAMMACTSAPATGRDVLPDGNLAFGARADRQVKIRGHRVELDEIESALLSLAAVDEAAVFTVPDGEGSSALHAAVVAGRSREFAHRAGTAWRSCARSFRRTRCPRRLAFCRSLPRTPTGKVDVHALVAQA